MSVSRAAAIAVIVGGVFIVFVGVLAWLAWLDRLDGRRHHQHRLPDEWKLTGKTMPDGTFLWRRELDHPAVEGDVIAWHEAQFGDHVEGGGS